jgi:hypothetical protein
MSPSRSILASSSGRQLFLGRVLECESDGEVGDRVADACECRVGRWAEGLDAVGVDDEQFASWGCEAGAWKSCAGEWDGT